MGTMGERRTIGARNNKGDGNNKATKKGRSLLLSEMQKDTGLQYLVKKDESEMV